MPTASLDLYCIDPAKVPSFWPLVKNSLNKALEATELGDLQALENEILGGKQLLWLAFGKHLEAIATTQIVKPYYRKICVVTACSGSNIERWLPLYERIEKYARDEGCAAMRIYGRKGWERVLNGYHVEHVVLEKELGRD